MVLMNRRAERDLKVTFGSEISEKKLKETDTAPKRELRLSR